MYERISIDPRICHGQACVRGTRIPVHQIVRMLANGDSIEELLEALANRCGDEFKTPLFKDDGQLRKIVDIRINGKAFDEHRKLYGQYLSANDVISFAKACC